MEISLELPSSMYPSKAWTVKYGFDYGSSSCDDCIFAWEIIIIIIDSEAPISNMDPCHFVVGDQL